MMASAASPGLMASTSVRPDRDGAPACNYRLAHVSQLISPCCLYTLEIINLIIIEFKHNI